MAMSTTPTFQHGSHAHPLLRFRCVDELRAAVELPRYSCSLCAAALAAAPVFFCQKCNFALCKKCFDVDEKPFAEPQIVVRNPLLDPHDENVCMRTRPRSTGHRLNVLYPDAMMEVVAFTECKEEGVTYFRQAQGGWMLATDVVCVFPTTTPMASLVSVRLQYIVHGSADLLPVEELAAMVREAAAMIAATPPYGAIMTFHLLLPMMLHVSNGVFADEDVVDEPGRLARDIADLCVAALDHALSTIDSGATRSLHAVHVPQHFAVRMAMRAVSVLWHLREVFPAATRGGHICERIVQLIHDFSTVLTKSDASAMPRRTYLEVGIDQWETVVVNQQADMAELDTAMLAMAGVELALQLLLQADPTGESWGARVTLNRFTRLRRLIAAYPNHTAGIATAFLQLAARLARGAVSMRELRETQAQFIDMDVVELVVKCVNLSSDGDGVALGCAVVEELVRGNEPLVRMLHHLLMPPLFKCLRQTKSLEVSKQCLGALAAIVESASTAPAAPHSTSTDAEVDAECEGAAAAAAPLAPSCCTQTLSNKAPIYQRVVVVDLAFGPAALCEACAGGHCGNVLEPDARVIATRMMLARCQCPTCSSSTSDGAAPLALQQHSQQRQQVMVRHPSKVQQALIADHIGYVLLGKVRQHRTAIIDAVSRLSLCLVSANEELAAEILASMHTITSAELTSEYRHAALFVASVRRSQILKRQLQSARLIDSDVAHYLNDEFSRAATMPPMSYGGATCGPACGELDSSSTLTPSRGDMQIAGLTPSPQFGGPRDAVDEACGHAFHAAGAAAAGRPRVMGAFGGRSERGNARYDTDEDLLIGVAPTSLF